MHLSKDFLEKHIQYNIFVILFYYQETETPHTDFRITTACCILILAASVWVFIGRCFGLSPCPYRLFLLGGLDVVNPNEIGLSRLFGAYKGPIKNNGFFWVNPYFSARRFLCVRETWTASQSKVKIRSGTHHDSIVLFGVWKTPQAAFECGMSLPKLIINRASSSRKLAGHYPYDT
jgi:hypothetical protein